MSKQTTQPNSATDPMVIDCIAAMLVDIIVNLKKRGQWIELKRKRGHG